MNGRMVVYLIAKMLGAEAALLLVPALVSLIYGETKVALWFVLAAALTLVVFAIFGIKGPKNRKIYAKEGMVIVCIAWIMWSLFGALPAYLSGAIPNYLDAFFETISGFTTTGSTIIEDMTQIPKGIMFWRSMTHWIGGMGVLMFVMLINTLDKSSTMHLMRAELPGPEIDKLVPKARQTAQILYGIYLGLSLILCVLLMLCGMDFYDSLIHTFSTAGTGGFSNYSASIGYFSSPQIEWVLMIFMALFGINFNLFFLFLLKEYKAVFKNEELRTYFGIIGVATVLVTINILDVYPQPGVAIRQAAFQVVSIITTTGFATVDYNAWPVFSHYILLALMFIGACASSTGGGAKIPRILIMFKSLRKQIQEMVHPQSVNIIKVNGKKMSNSTVTGVHTYFMAYLLVMIVSLILVALDNYDFGTTFSAVLTTLNNTGPGIGHIKPDGTFADFSALSKIVLCIDMLVGRLEIFPFLMLFTASAWGKKF